MPDQQGQRQQLDRQELQEVTLAILRAVDIIVHILHDILVDHYTTSALSEADWVDELLIGHPQRIRNVLGLNRGTFTILRRSLQLLEIDSSRHVSIDEQLSIFLYTVVTGMGCVHVGERFQRSPGTITK
jgi:hypothetical protein